MTLQEEKFVNAYFLHNGNATRAAEEAGYSDPNAVGSKVKKQPEVAAAIQERLDDMAMPANEVLARLAEHGRASLGDVLKLSGRGVSLDIPKAIKSGKIHLFKSYSKTKEGVKVELVDVQGALTTLARHHKLLTDKVEHEFTKLTDAELVALAKQSLEQGQFPDTEAEGGAAGDGAARPDSQSSAG